jgi:ribosomal protein L32
MSHQALSDSELAPTRQGDNTYTHTCGQPIRLSSGHNGWCLTYRYRVDAQHVKTCPRCGYRLRPEHLSPR